MEGRDWLLVFALLLIVIVGCLYLLGMRLWYCRRTGRSFWSGEISSEYTFHGRPLDRREMEEMRESLPRDTQLMVNHEGDLSLAPKQDLDDWLATDPPHWGW